MKKLLTLTFSILVSCSFAQWELQNSTITENLQSVHFVNNNIGWAAGSKAHITYTNNGGETWNKIYGGSSSTDNIYFHSVCFIDQNIGIIAGHRNDVSQPWFTAKYEIATWDGGYNWDHPTGWIVYANFGSGWVDVCYVDNTGWKLYNKGTLFKSVNDSLTYWNNAGTFTNDLNAVFFIDQNNGWVAGDGGYLSHTIDGGENWSQLNTNSSFELKDVYFINSNTGFISGDQTLKKTVDGGLSWYEAVFPDFVQLITDIEFVDQNNGWACGYTYEIPERKGVILNTKNGGETWTAQHIAHNTDLIRDLDFVSNTQGWAVGSEGVVLKIDLDALNLRFTQLNSMIYPKYGAGYTSDENYIYSVCGGISETPFTSTSIERYDLTFKTWDEISSDLIPRKYCSAEYIVSQEKIYIFNGDTYSSNTYTDTVEIVDVVTGNISYSATNPHPVEYGGSAVWNNKIYLFGGSNSDGCSNRLYEFDPVSNNWTRLADMPEAKQTNGEIIDGVLYVFGGYCGSSSKRIDAYNIQNDSWSHLGDMPAGISAHATAKSINEIWIVGSYNDLNFLAVFDTETNKFTQVSSDMIGRRHAGAIIKGIGLYVFGGNQLSNFDAVLNSMEQTNISGYINNINESNNAQLKIEHSYPNPFTTTTTISYNLPQPSSVQLSIFNHLGQQVDFIQQNQSQGQQKVTWDATGLPSGVYYFRLQAGEQMATGKLLLLR